MGIQLDLFKDAAVEALNSAKLSPREIEVALAIARGETPAIMARKFGISAKTLSTYRARLIEKLKPIGAHNNARIAVLYYQAGLVDGVICESL